MSNVEQGMVNDEVLYRSRSAGACAAWRALFLDTVNWEPSLRNSCNGYSILDIPALFGGGVFDPPGPKVGPINNANDNSILISHMENLEVIYG